jgi:uncharacterized repeat protein (TIGR03803 family)
MNYARQQDKPFSMMVACVAAMVVLTLTGTTIPAQAQTYKVLYQFPINGPEPQWPGGPLTQGRNGDLYGWSYEGGVNNDGSLWKTTPSGSVSVLYSFTATNGPDCQNGMTLGTDGNFYGTALASCTGAGYVFKLTPSGNLTVLHTFTGAPDGDNPGPLTLYTDGNFYGVTNKGGANNYGTVFKITPAGTLTILYSFDGTNYFANPTYGLTVGNDGNFYGTQWGGNGLGSVFKITPAGVLTVLHTFTGNPDGAEPASGVIQGKDGNFYGDTEYGGAYGYGTLFKMTPSGTLKILYSFNSSTDYATNPTAPLLQATDGNFYGVLVSRFQDLFRFTASGTLTVLEKFVLPGGVYPYWPLIQDTNGILYGLLQQGGTVNGGEFYSLNIGAKPFVSLVSTSGKVGSQIGILGQGFSKSSVVKFGGVQATTLTLEGTKYISATVPAGAIDGKVTVTTGSTELTSLQTFIVHNSWSNGAAMPIALMGAAAGAIGSDVYVVGGYTLNGAVGNNQIYNPEENTWTTGASDPNPRAFTAYAVVNKKLYMFGGSNGSALLNIAEAYDPATNTWSTLAPVPYVSETASAVADKDVIYVIGGQDYSGYLTTVESYNTTTNTWTAEAPLPDAQGWAAVGLLGTTVVAADGSNGSINLGINQGYNVTNNTWSELTPDPTPRVPGCYGVINGKLYVAGGLTQTMITLNEAYNPGTKKWATLAPMPEAPGQAAGSAADGGNLYCFGGGVFLTNVDDYVLIYQP